MSGYWNSVQRLIRDGITTKEIEKLRKKLFRKELLEEREESGVKSSGQLHQLG